jgi:hypothetical protein
MERWKNGMMGKSSKIAVHIVPLFRYSIIPAVVENGVYPYP